MTAPKSIASVEVEECTPLLRPGISHGERVPLHRETSSDGETPEPVETKDDEEASASITLIVFPILLLGIFLSNVVSSIIIATNQHIASEFDALSSSAWLLTIYTLAQSASQPLYGKLSDIFRRKECLVFCWVFFGIGCLLVGIGQSYWHLLLGRAIGGIGTAGKITLTSIIVADVVPLPKVAQYRGYVNLAATVARSLGGPIGGWLAGSIGWRWPFVVQLPITLIGLCLVLWKLPGQEVKCLPDDGLSPSWRSKLSRVDFMGFVTLVGSVLTGLLSLDFATKGGFGLKTVSLGSSFMMFLLLFTVVEKHVAKEPILPLDLVLKRDVLTSYSIMCFQAAGQFGLLYTIPIYFQIIGLESVASSSSRIVPVVVGNACGTILSQRLITRTHKYKMLTMCGNLAALAGFLLIFVRWRGSTLWLDSLLVFLPGAGMGIIQATTFVHLAASLDHSEIAIASASWFLAQNVGILLGASLSTATIGFVLRNTLEKALEGVEDKSQIIRNILSDVEYTQRLPTKIWELVSQSYIRAIACSNLVSFGCVMLGLTVAVSLKERPLRV